jgi:hypothetical protein
LSETPSIRCSTLAKFSGAFTAGAFTAALGRSVVLIR